MFCARWLACLFLSGCFVCTAPVLALDDQMHHHEAGEKLGKVSFPISCAPGSQKLLSVALPCFTPSGMKRRSSSSWNSRTRIRHVPWLTGESR